MNTGCYALRSHGASRTRICWWSTRSSEPLSCCLPSRIQSTTIPSRPVPAKLQHDSEETRSDYIDRIVRGGFPVAVARTGSRRERFLDSYVADIVNRDVIQLSEIERRPQMRALIQLVVARSGRLLVPGALGSELGLPQPTVKRYLALLEEVFLIKRIPAWSRNLSSRTVGTAKVAMVDSGIAAICRQPPPV